MTEPFKVACIQTTAGPDTVRNLAAAAPLVRAAHAEGAALVCLPEYFSALEVRDGRLVLPSWPEERHPALARSRELAGELGVWLLLGSIAVDAGSGKIHNRSLLLDPSGLVSARYDKLHLFDVDLADGERYEESATIRPGREAVLAATPWGALGMTICYDLRFPQLYRALAQSGAAFLSVPAAFTRTTGQAHWHVLLRSRAIETGCYVFAPCQCGGACYGHSLIVDPWGRIVAEADEMPGFIIAEVDPAAVLEARAMIPSLQHDRPFAAPQPALSRAAG